MLTFPTYEDLVLYDDFGVRGRPNARFKQWQLNSYGFRSPEMTPLPRQGCQRVMILGASESFGLYEAAGREYPAQLARRLQEHGCYEVVNAAIAGLTVRGIHALWSHWASQFKPDIVVIYPTPGFYLGSVSPSDLPTRRSPPAPRPWWTPRLTDRAVDRLEYPAFWQRRRVAGWLAAARRGRPDSWLYHQVPPDRLHDFLNDLELLITAVSESGARPILVTHATAFHLPPREDEREALYAWYSSAPRATGNVPIEFERAAANGMKELALRRRLAIADAASHMYGRRDWFGRDLAHLSETGASVLADLIAIHITDSRQHRKATLPTGPVHAVQ